MIEFRCPVPTEELTSQLEDHFCEWTLSPWMLDWDRASGAFTLSGFFDTEADGEKAWAEIHDTFPQLPAAPERHPVDDRDWKEAYKFHFQPWSLRGLHWVPAWLVEENPTPEGESRIILDPGMAFGTGSHETTRLCAARLLDCRDAWAPDLASKTVIDAGCGSGILALSARALGFGQVRGFDNDPEATRISEENRILNAIPDDCSFRHQGLEDGLANTTADLVLANIQADILSIYAQELVAAINPGGTLAMSGILTEEVDTVASRFHPVLTQIWGTYTTDQRTDGEWSDLCYQRA